MFYSLPPSRDACVQMTCSNRGLGKERLRGRVSRPMLWNTDDSIRGFAHAWFKLALSKQFAVGYEDVEDDIEGRSMVGVLGGFENVYERVYAREFGM